jgi:hypothetical protein
VNGGYVKVYRSLLEHPLWTGERFSRGQAWFDLILRAAYADRESFATHGPAQIERGQVLTTQTALAHRWRWDRQTVSLFFRGLRRHSMVRIETSKATSTGYTLITICNYEKFQSNDDDASSIEPGIAARIQSSIGSTSTPHRLHIDATRSKKEKNNKKVEKETDRDTPPPAADAVADFEQFWSLYPRKRGRRDAEKAWTTLKPEPELVKAIMTAVVRWIGSEEWQSRGGRFVPYPAKWLRGRRWEDQVPSNGSTQNHHALWTSRTAGNVVAAQEALRQVGLA